MLRDLECSLYIEQEHSEFYLIRLIKKKIGIIAIQEVHWIGQGVLEKRDHAVFYSCDRKQHLLGVGFVGKENFNT